MEPLQEIDGFALERIAHPLDADVVQQFVHQLGEVLRTTVHNVQVVLVLLICTPAHHIAQGRLDQRQRRLDLMDDMRKEIHLFMEHLLVLGLLISLLFALLTQPEAMLNDQHAEQKHDQYDQNNQHRPRNRGPEARMYGNHKRRPYLHPLLIGLSPYPKPVLPGRYIIIKDRFRSGNVPPGALIPLQQTLNLVREGSRKPEQRKIEPERIVFAIERNLRHEIEVLRKPGFMVADLHGGQHHGGNVRSSRQRFGIESDEAIVGSEVHVSGGAPEGAVRKLRIQQTIDTGIDISAADLGIELHKALVGGKPQVPGLILQRLEKDIGRQCLDVAAVIHREASAFTVEHCNPNTEAHSPDPCLVVDENRADLVVGQSATRRSVVIDQFVRDGVPTIDPVRIAREPDNPWMQRVLDRRGGENTVERRNFKKRV